MTELIKRALAEEGVALWSCSRRTADEAQLYFIGRTVDMKRVNSTDEYTVTVYRDFEKGGRALRGSSAACITPGQSYQEILTKIKRAHYAAAFAGNPAFDMPTPVQAEPTVMSGYPDTTVEQAAIAMAQAMYSAEGECDGIINSAEFFSRSVTEHLVMSTGTDVCYTKYSISGEFVVQCKTPADVEMYHMFSYDTPDTEALRAKTAEALRTVCDRAVAKPELPGGTYTVILTGDQVGEVLSYYEARSSAAMIYPGYSSWQVGTEVQGAQVNGEKLNITLHATLPYSPEGIPMVDRTLIKDGRLELVHGSSRFCSYLGVEPTGDYSAVICHSGEKDYRDMTAVPHLRVADFSDFQMDAMDGHFAGEIRLAYLYDGETTRIVTGGSVNGNIADCRGSLSMSKERYSSSRYSGPYAITLEGVKVAGSL